MPVGFLTTGSRPEPLESLPVQAYSSLRILPLGPMAWDQSRQSVPFRSTLTVASLAPVNLLCNCAAQLSEEPLRGTTDQIIHRMCYSDPPGQKTDLTYESRYASSLHRYL